MGGDDDVKATPRDGGTAPLFHTIEEDGCVRLRPVPRGAPIHQPRRDASRARSIGSAPITPVLIADSTPAESTPFVRIVGEAPADPTKVVPGPARASRAVIEQAKTTLPSRKAPEQAAAQSPSVTRIVVLAATVGALIASLVLVAAYLLLLHGR